MSSDLLEDVDDKNGACVMLSMKASGYAHLTIIDNEDESIDFELEPNEIGLALAEKIENALRAWREQVLSNGLI